MQMRIVDDGSCELPEPVSGIVFSGAFGGTVADGSTTAKQYAFKGSESWAGFANEDASLYPFTFGDGGSTYIHLVLARMLRADVYFRFEFNPYPATEPSYNTEVVSLGTESAEYAIDIPAGENTYGSFLLYVSTPDVAVTLNNVTANTSDLSGPVDVVGCMDANAANYNADATLQGYDQWGNLQCVYASCDDIPEYGCIYRWLRAFNEGFDAVACSTWRYSM